MSGLRGIERKSWQDLTEDERFLRLALEHEEDREANDVSEELILRAVRGEIEGLERAILLSKIKNRSRMSPKKIFLTINQLREFRDSVLENIRKHCLELYKSGVDLETCRAAAVIAAAEIADVLKEQFRIKI